MKSGYKALRVAIFNCPLAIKKMDSKMLKLAESYLPFSTGIEIECLKKDSYSDDIFRKCGLISVETDSNEQRYRIHSGVRGMIELYNICQLLKEHSHFNISSGIHYHIDARSFYFKLDVDKVKKEKWILDSLESWNYTGSFNKREIRVDKNGWVRICKIYKTIEFRIGEMSFDYETLIKRIIHCQNIVKRLKNSKHIFKSKGVILSNENENDLDNVVSGSAYEYNNYRYEQVGTNSITVRNVVSTVLERGSYYTYEGTC